MMGVDLPVNMSVASGEHFITGLTHSLLKTYSREITVLASTLSVLVLMIVGTCIWCIANMFKQKKSQEVCVTGDISETSVTLSASPESSFFEGWKPSPAPTSKKKPPFQSKMEGFTPNWKKKLAIHKNIITPDKNIEFVVPTISMPAQPASTEYREKSETLPTCSTKSLFEIPNPQQYYPQLKQGVEEQSPQIGYSLYYEAATQILYVRLLGGQNFPDKIKHCIEIKIYPGRSGKQRTKEFEETTPVYNQEFNFHIRKSTLNTRVLRIKAIIPGSPKRILGCINLALKDLPGFDADEVNEDVSSSQLWKRLDQPSDKSEGVKLQVSLKWATEPTPGILTLKVIEARGLHEANNDNDFTSTHVKVTLHEQGRNIKSRKTRLIRWGSLPVFDDVFVVTIPYELLSQISFQMQVIARGRLGSKVVLGKISIGSVPYVNPSMGGSDFWEDMCHQPNKEMVRWLDLRNF